MLHKRAILLLVSVFVLFAFTNITSALAQNNNDVVDIFFPVLGEETSDEIFYFNDFGDPRGGGTRSHEGIDIRAPKMTSLLAPVSGDITSIAYPEPSWGYAIFIEDEEGYEYWYLHLNNDTPGTDDGKGGGKNAFAVYTENGNTVKAGQVIGYAGDSGNAESTVSHLHFEIHSPDGDIINPYESLNEARHIEKPPNPPQQDNEMLPFSEFDGGASIAAGVFNESVNKKQLAVAAGPGGGPHVRVLDENENELFSFFAYDERFRGGVDVAAGDLDGDGTDEIIVGPGEGGGPHVKMFEPDGIPFGVRSFFAFTSEFTGGVNVAAADMNNDGEDEIIVGAGPGGGPHVRIFNADGTLYETGGFFTYDAAWRGGVDVAAISNTNDSSARIITGPGPGGGPEVRVFNTEGGVVNKFYAYDEEFRGGIKVDTYKTSDSLFSRDSYGRKVSAEEREILTSPARGGGPDFRVYNIEGEEVRNDEEFERWWQGGYDIAGGDEVSWVVSLEERRVSLREVFK